VLLYGQQLFRVAAMTRSHVHDRGDSLSIRFGPHDVEIPEPLAGFVRAHLQAPRRHTSIAVPHAANLTREGLPRTAHQNSTPPAPDDDHPHNSSGGSSAACAARYFFTQPPTVVSFSPYSRDTSAIDRVVSTTSLATS
jgi:hypothetical protein